MEGGAGGGIGESHTHGRTADGRRQKKDVQPQRDLFHPRQASSSRLESLSFGEPYVSRRGATNYPHARASQTACQSTTVRTRTSTWIL